MEILQGLGVAQAAVTERWPWKEEKTITAARVTPSPWSISIGHMYI